MLAQVLTLLLHPLVLLMPHSCLPLVSHLSLVFHSWLSLVSLLSHSCLSLTTCLSLLTHLTGLSQASSSSSVSRWETWREGKSSKGFPPPLPNLGEQKFGNWKKLKLFLPSLRIPVQSGIFQALGLCLILEGVMSAVGSTFAGLCFQLWFETHSSTTSVPASWLCSSTQPTCGWRNCCSTKDLLNDNRTKCSGI